MHNAREHNLKSLDVEIPRGKFTVITGVSGSGKSTLAFDIVFNEGQRRYLESLNAYARQFVQSATRPDVDAIFGIPPTVAIEQRTSRGGRKSTVATLTEIYHFLRLLYVKLGTQYCPDCDVPIEPQTLDSIVANIFRNYRGERVGLLAPLVVSRKGVYTDLAKWAAGKGYTHLRVDGAFVPTEPWPRLARFIEHTIELPVAEVQVTPENEAHAARRRSPPRSNSAKASCTSSTVSNRSSARSRRETPSLVDMTRVGVFGQARVSLVRAQLPRARSAAFLVQLEARLVCGMLWHRLADRRSGVGRGTPEDRRGRSRARLVARMAGDRRAVSRSATAGG